jgi:hypothetical protein
MAIRLWGTTRLANTTTIPDEYRPAFAALTNGGFVIAWQEDVP